MDQFPDFFFCDRNIYPIARADEKELALQHFPEIQANREELNTILAHNQLSSQSSFTDDQKLLPAGETGYYCANGILIASTLK